MPQYSGILNSTQPNRDGGFKSEIYFNPIVDITTWQRPAGTGTTLGDKSKITVAHTWAATKGAFTWQTKIGSVLLTSESVGDEGAKVIVWTAKFKVLGFDAPTLDQMVNMLNDQVVVFLKDANCLVADAYYQLGDDCTPVVASVSSDGKDSLPSSTAQKEFEVTLTSKKLFFYTAALDVTFV